MDRDKFLEADEAKEFGIIDEVFDKRPDAAEATAPRQCSLNGASVQARLDGLFAIDRRERVND